MAYIPSMYRENFESLSGDSFICQWDKRVRGFGVSGGHRVRVVFSGYLLINSTFHAVESMGSFNSWFDGCGEDLKEFLSTPVSQLDGFQYLGVLDDQETLYGVIKSLIESSYKVHFSVEDGVDGKPVGCFAYVENRNAAGKVVYENFVLFSFRNSSGGVLLADVVDRINFCLSNSVSVQFEAVDSPGNRVVTIYKRFCRDHGGEVFNQVVNGHPSLLFVIPGALARDTINSLADMMRRV